MLDKLPTSIRDLALLVVPIFLGWLSTNVVPALQHTSPLLAVMAAAALTYITTSFSTITRAYGVGQTDDREKD